MKPSEIEVGKIYKNRGAGTTLRIVTAIGPEDEVGRPYWFGAENRRPKGEPVVKYHTCFRSPRRGTEFIWSSEDIAYMRTFAAWCGGVCS